LSARYVFEYDLSNTIIDIGLRLDDVEAMGLEAETVRPMASLGAPRP